MDGKARGRSPNASSRRRERGAVLVEASLVGLLLMMLSAGTLEYASLFASTTDTSGAVRSGARAGSITTLDGTVGSDWNIIQALVSRAGSPRTDINRLVIYQADAANAGPPAACTGTGLPPTGTLCDVYTTADLTLSEAQIEALPAAQRQWPENARVAGADFLGVWVQVNRPRLFSNMIPSPAVYTDSFTMLIAPKPIAPSSSGWSPAALAGTNPDMTWEGAWPWPDQWWCDEGPNNDQCPLPAPPSSGGGGPAPAPTGLGSTTSGGGS